MVLATHRAASYHLASIACDIAFALHQHPSAMRSIAIVSRRIAIVSRRITFRLYQQCSAFRKEDEARRFTLVNWQISWLAVKTMPTQTKSAFANSQPSL